MTKTASPPSLAVSAAYTDVRSRIVELLLAARQAAARNVNALMTASYWEIGRRIVEAEQNGKRRAGYGEQLIERLSADLTQPFGRGFSPDSLENMRRFFQTYSATKISETVSGELTLSRVGQAFTLPWSAYVRLLSVKGEHARAFYETEALRGGWSVRQLARQIESQFYERTALSTATDWSFRMHRCPPNWVDTIFWSNCSGFKKGRLDAHPLPALKASFRRPVRDSQGLYRASSGRS